MNDDRKNFFHIFENALDMILNMAAFAAAYVILVPLYGEATLDFLSTKTLLMLFIATVISSLFYQFFNVYRPIPYIHAGYSIANIVFANLTFFTLSGLTSFIVTRNDERCLFLVLWTLISAFISTAILVFKKRIIIFIVRLTRKQRDLIRKVILVGNNAETAKAFVKEVISDTHNGIMLLGTVGNMDESETGCESLGGLSDLERIIKEYKPDYAIFAVDYYDKKKVVELVNICDEGCVKVYFLPVIFGFFKSAKQLERVGTIPLINVHSTPLDNRFNAFVKRVVDIIGSIFLIILTSPIMAAAAIGTRLSSPGPILFKQTRVGRMGKKFVILKFRSMRENDEEKTGWSRGIDPRKTRFGNFMRKTSIDELPQFFNVLKGDMSLVGPRPEVPHYVEDFKGEIPLYMVKHYVKPGITGLAQIKGLRGDTSISDRIHEDIAYIENWSLALDIIILLKTPFRAFNRSERYGAPEASSTEYEQIDMFSMLEGGVFADGEENSSEGEAGKVERVEPAVKNSEERVKSEAGEGES